MTPELITLHEPIECPYCMESERLGFLKKIVELGEATHFVNNQIDYECMTCHALFQVKKHEL